jgi:protocatechuate 3,4-dioxygenase beta subunit
MRVLRALVVLAISVTSVDVLAARPGQSAAPASLSGTAADAAGRAMSNTGVQLRNVSSGQLVGTATTNAIGQFSFPGLNPGTYVVEVVSATGQIVGTSGSVVVGAGAAMTGVSVTASAATKAAAAGAGSPFTAHHAIIILGAAAAAGVAGGIAMASGGTASASQ